MSTRIKLQKIMLNEMASHKPFSEMSKSEFKSFRKTNFELMNKWKKEYISLFVKNFKQIFPEGVINLKKGDKGFALKDLKEDQIINAWSFNQRQPKEYEYETTDLGKEIDPDTFFVNVLEWTAGFAPKQIDNKMEQIRDMILKKMDVELVNSKVPFDADVVGDIDDLESEGFFERYPNLE